MGPRNTRALPWGTAGPLNPCELVVGPVFCLSGRDMFLGFSSIHGVCLKFSSSPWLGAWMVGGRLFLCLPKLGNRACWGGKEKVAEVAVRVASTPSWCDMSPHEASRRGWAQATETLQPVSPHCPRTVGPTGLVGPSTSCTTRVVKEKPCKSCQSPSAGPAAPPVKVHHEATPGTSSLLLH